MDIGNNIKSNSVIFQQQRNHHQQMLNQHHHQQQQQQLLRQNNVPHSSYINNPDNNILNPNYQIDPLSLTNNFEANRVNEQNYDNLNQNNSFIDTNSVVNKPGQKASKKVVAKRAKAQNQDIVSNNLAPLMEKSSGAVNSNKQINSSMGLKQARSKKTKGRVKIKMEFIENKIRRYTTFSKRKTGIMKKAYELSTLTGTQVMLLVASETGHVYTFATDKLKPMITSEAGKSLIQSCLSCSQDDENNESNNGDHLRNEISIENFDNNDMDDMEDYDEMENEEDEDDLEFDECDEDDLNNIDSQEARDDHSDKNLYQDENGDNLNLVEINEEIEKSNNRASSANLKTKLKRLKQNNSSSSLNLSFANKIKNLKKKGQDNLNVSDEHMYQVQQSQQQLSQPSTSLVLDPNQARLLANTNESNRLNNNNNNQIIQQKSSSMSTYLIPHNQSINDAKNYYNNDAQLNNNNNLKLPLVNINTSNNIHYSNGF